MRKASATMRILITGGAGFIGAEIARAHLNEGHDVTVVDNLVAGRRGQVPAGARFHLLDIRDAELERVFASEGPFDVVSHHAALKDVRKALVDPRQDAEVNVLGTLNVLRCAAEYSSGRFIFPSSAAIYGDPMVFPTPESAPMAPISPYGISKAAGERYCAFFAQQRGLAVVALRYGTVFGPAATEESEAGVITKFARQMLSDRHPVIFGDGEQTRDLIHVDDIVAANLLAAQGAPRPWAVYNVGTGVETSVNDVCHILHQSTGFAGAPQWQAAKAGEVRRNVLDASLIRRELGWSPRRALEEGLGQVVEAYRAQRNGLATAVS